MVAVELNVKEYKKGGEEGEGVFIHDGGATVQRGEGCANKHNVMW